WNFFFTGWGTQPALGALATMVFFAQPVPVYRPPGNKADPEISKLWDELNSVPTDQERDKVFGEMQKYTLDQVYALPFGSLTKVQAVRANVDGFVPFRIPRLYNVWFDK
ncbi:MAG TPA: hypothetical protein VIZ17_02020, partial [Acetobacteraceae bacterium]